MRLLSRQQCQWWRDRTDLIRSPLALNDEGGDKIGPVILNGRTDKGMPAIPMSPEQIKDVAAFLRGRQRVHHSKHHYGTAPVSNVPISYELDGRQYAVAGQAIPSTHL